MKKIASATLLLLAAPMVHADDAAMSKCRELADAGARLACYDAIPLAGAAKSVPAPVAQTVTPAPAAKVTAAAYTASVVSSSTPAPVAGSSTPAPVEERKLPPSQPVQPAQAQPPKDAVDRFGLESKQANEVQQIETSIEGPFEGWVPRQRIRLANGQVWEIADGTTHWMSVDNPKVVIWRGLLGAIYMSIGKLNQSPRVERVK